MSFPDVCKIMKSEAGEERLAVHLPTIHQQGDRFFFMSLQEKTGNKQQLINCHGGQVKIDPHGLL